MKKNYILLLTLLISSLSFGQIFITEIADPNNEFGARYVELYNAGAMAVDLSAGGGYKLQRYTNGGVSPQAAVALTGTISAGGFYIVSPNAGVFWSTYGFQPNQDIGTGGPADSNGDDQIQLLDTSDAVVDLFGVPGEDGTGTCHEFEDGRAERIASVTSGNAGAWDESNWNIWADSTIMGCTNHTNSPRTAPDDFDPCAWIGATPVTTTVVEFNPHLNSVIEGVGTVDVCVAITNPDGSNDTTVDIVMNMASTATNGADFTMITFAQTLTFPAGSTADQCLTFTITDDAIAEGDEDIILNIQNVGGGNSAALGKKTKHVLTINSDPSDVVAPAVGDIIITEIMQNPSASFDSDGEYFEVYNTTGAPIDLIGWELTDTNSSHFFNNNNVNGASGTDPNVTIVPAGGYLVFVSDGDPSINGGIAADYNFDGSGTGLPNGAGSLTLTAGSTIIDAVAWDGGPNFPDPNGASMSLHIDYLTDGTPEVFNDDGANWETVAFTFGAGDNGTPGGRNDTALSVSLNEIEGFLVFPNPINAGTFRINSLSRANKSIQIYDMLGKQVYSKSVENKELINVSNLNTGIYILKVNEEGRLATRKLVVE